MMNPGGGSLGYEESCAHQQATDLVIAADRLDDEVHAFMHPHNDPVFQVLLAHEPRGRSLAFSRRRPH